MTGWPVRPRPVRLSLLVPTLALGLAACSSPPLQPDDYFRLEVAPPAAAVAPPLLDGLLQVDRLAAEDMTGDRAMHWSDAALPAQIRRLPRLFWSETPPAMIQSQLVRHLQAAGIAADVVAGDLRVAAKYEIRGRLRRFEQVSGPAPHILVDLDLGLTAASGGNLLFLKNYRVERPFAGTEGDAMARVFSDALAAVFTDFEADLRARVAK